MKPRWSFSQTKTGRLQSASRSADFGWSCCPTCSTAPPAQSLRNSGAWGLPECPAVALPSQASAALPHLQTSGGPAQRRTGAITYCQPQKPTADPPPAWGSGPVVPWLQSARSLTNRGGVLESVASLARCGTQARFREQRRAVCGWDLGLGSG